MPKKVIIIVMESAKIVWGASTAQNAFVPCSPGALIQLKNIFIRYYIVLLSLLFYVLAIRFTMQYALRLKNVMYKIYLLNHADG